MTPDDALVRHYVATSMVMRLATLSGRGHASLTPIWFVPHDGALVAATAATTLAARNIAADPRVSVLLDGEQAGRSELVVRLWATATVHAGMAPAAALARMAAKYYLSPAGARSELAHARQWPLRMRYYAQSEAVWLAVRPAEAELLRVPHRVDDQTPMTVADPGASRVPDALVTELGPEPLVVDPDVIDAYRHDRATAVVPGRPVALVRARHTADVQGVLRVASRLGVPVVPRGLGTGLSGGSAAVDGSIVVSTEQMRHLSIETDAMVAVVGPGIRNAELKDAARARGLWYPPDPSSFEICSVGGNLATNAGGLCCVKYGVTTDYVLGIEVVLADGRAVHLGGRTIKDVAGYDLKRLFVGSEGTLGVITEATLRLRPLPPPASTVVATFSSLVDAGRAVADIVTSVRPAALELMDRAAVAAVERVKPMGLDVDAAALLLAQTDGAADEAEAIAAACERAGAAYVAHTDDPDEGELLMGARRMAIPCVERMGTVLIEDVGVPVPRIPELLAAVERIAAEHDTAVPVIGHAGDGNFHPLVTYEPTDPAAAARAGAAFDAVMDAALALGGTVTGEHGIGVLKARHLRAQLGDDVMELTARVKQALDPDGILNPGKWI